MFDVLDAYTNQYQNSIPELQLSNLWVFNFLDRDFPNHDLLIKSTNLPLYSFDMEKTEFDLIVPPKKEKYGGFNFTFYETVKFEGFNYCKDWFSSVYDLSRRLVRKNFHSKKKNAIIKFIKIYSNVPKGPMIGFNSVSKNNSIIQTAQFNLYGLMIKGVSDLDLSDDGEALTFDVEMEVQQIEYKKTNLVVK